MGECESFIDALASSERTGSPLSTRPVQSRHIGRDRGAAFTGPKVEFFAVIGELLGPRGIRRF
jgi:hypothetical protein